MGVSRGRGWTDKDIDPDDPEAYQGGGIVTSEIKAREEAEKRKKESKKRIEKARRMAAEAKAARQRRSKMPYTINF
jgi:hypothetical protein